MRRLVLAVLLMGLSLQVAAELRLRDDRGQEVVVPQPPQRIVTLLPSLTESVCALGACDRLVGTDRFSNSPRQVRALPKLGGLDDAMVERIAALKPDVVLAAPSARVIERLESLGIRVVVVESKTHADVRRSLILLGQLLDASVAAEVTWRRIEATLAKAAATVPASIRGRRVYFEVDATPYAAGASSFIGETLQRLGMGNVITPQMGPFPRLNPEYVVQAQPDIVMGAQTNVRDMQKRPGWAMLVALRERRTCGFDPEPYELLVRPGPRMGEAAQLIADCLARLAVRP